MAGSNLSDEITFGGFKRRLVKARGAKTSGEAEAAGAANAVQ